MLALLWIARFGGSTPLDPATPADPAGPVALESQVRSGATTSEPAPGESGGEASRGARHAAEDVDAKGELEPRRLRLAGRLRRSDDGAPAAACRLRVQSGTASHEVTTDADGRFATGPVLEPGLVQVEHVADPGRADYAASLPILPAQVYLTSVSGGEREFTLRMPGDVVRVRVRDGARAAGGAAIHWRLIRGVSAQSYEYATGETRSDPDGLASIGLPAGGAGSRLEVFAQLEDDRRSQTAALEPPWPVEPVLLDLVRGGHLVVRTLDEAGRPLAARRVHLMRKADDVRHLAIWTTDAEGACRSELLTPGPYWVLHVDPTTREERGAHVTIRPGRVTELDLELAHLSVDVAAAGRVVDEDGQPLAGVLVALVHPGAGTTTVATDADGRFEFRAPACEELRVALDHDPWTDVYEPPHVDAPFGRRDLRFVRTQRLSFVAFELEVVDARTAEPVEGVVVLGHRPPYTENVGEHHALGGRLRLTYPDAGDVELRIRAPGYRPRSLTIASLFDPTDPSIPRRRIELERGFRTRIRAVTPISPVDADTRVPLPEARVLVDGAVVATADPDGWIDLDLPTWPERLVLVHDGLTSVDLDPTAWLGQLRAPTVEMR